MYSITAKRMISGLVLKYLKDVGLVMGKSYATTLPASSKVLLTRPRVLLENYYPPGALEHAIGNFIDHYNHNRYHESISNLTPADVYFGRAETILRRRKEIKHQTIQKRRLLHHQNAA